MARYEFKEVKPDCYDLYEEGSFLCSFTRSTFRESLGHLGRGENWIGSMLRLFHKKFPVPFKPHFQTPIARAESVYGEFVLADYLRSKGLRLVKPMPVSDADIVNILESKGYLISGMLGDQYYETVKKQNVESESRLKEKV